MNRMTGFVPYRNVNPNAATLNDYDLENGTPGDRGRVPFQNAAPKDVTKDMWFGKALSTPVEGSAPVKNDASQVVKKNNVQKSSWYSDMPIMDRVGMGMNALATVGSMVAAVRLSTLV